MPRLTNQRVRRLPARFASNNAEEIVKYLPATTSASGFIFSGATPIITRRRIESRYLPPIQPTTEPKTFLIVNLNRIWSGVHVPLRFMDGEVHTSSRSPETYTYAISHILTDNENNVTHIRPIVQLGENCEPHRDVKICLDEEDVWQSKIQKGDGLNIRKATLARHFLKPTKNLEEDVKVMTLDNVPYRWTYDVGAKTYTMSEGKKMGAIKICDIRVVMAPALLARDIVDGAEIRIWDYDMYMHLYDAIVTCAVIFLNDRTKYS